MSNIDLATLAIRVRQEGVVEATRALSGLGVAGTQTEQRLGGVEKASKGANVSLNGLRSGLLSVTRNMLDLNPAVAQTGALLGNLAIGAAPMVAILGGVAALGFAFETLTKDSREAAKAQDEAFAALKKMNAEARAGFGGNLVLQLEDARKGLVRLREELTKPLPAAKAAAGSPSTLLNLLTLNFTALGAQAGAQAAAVGAKADDIKKAEEEQAKRWAQITVGMKLQIDRQRELNEAVGQGQLALDLINSKYDYLGATLQHSVGYTEKQRKELDGLSAGARLAANEAARLADNLRKAGELEKTLEQLDKMRKTVDALKISLASLPARLTPNDPFKLTPLPGGSKPQTEEERQAAIQQGYGIGNSSNKSADDMRSAWFRAIDDIVRHGTESFGSLFDTVLRLNLRMLAKMQEDSRASGGKYQALSMGTAALGGGIAGFGIGSQIGSMSGGVGAGSLAKGAFGGAAAGALAGTAILPGIGTAIGAFVGEVAGLVGALTSGAAAAKERKKNEDELRQSLLVSVNAMRVLAGTADPLSQSLAESAAQFKKLRDENDAAFAGLKNQAERESKLAELNDLEAIRIRQIEEEAAAVRQSFIDDLGMRGLRAAGLDEQAAAMAQAIQDERERAEAIKRFGKDSAEVQSLVAVQAAEAAKRQRDLAEATREAAEASIKAAEAERERIAALNSGAQRGYLERYYAATGQDDLLFALRQMIEMQQAIRDGLSDVTLAILASAQQAERDQRERQKQTQVLEEQLSVLESQSQAMEQQISLQQQIIDETKKTIDALKSFSESLNLSRLTTLSPTQQYLEAKRQYDAIAVRAAAGDKQAAQQLPGYANTFLEQSRGMFASTSRYAQDFAQVQTFLGALEDQYGTQLSTEEQMLAQLIAQNQKLQEQIALLKEQIAATKAVSGSVAGAITGWWSTQPVGRTPVGTNPAVPEVPIGINPPSRPIPASDEAGAYTSLYDPYMSYTFRLPQNQGWPFTDIRGNWFDGSSWHPAGPENNPDDVTGFAMGGDPTTRAFIAGERGAELITTGPGARVHTSRDLNASVVAAIEAQTAEVRAMRGELAEIKKENRMAGAKARSLN